MGILTSPGQWNHEIAQTIYKSSRKLVDALVKAGKIPAHLAESEFAKEVARRLTEAGLKVPEKISQLLK